MKSFLFICTLVVSQMASADIQIMSYEGISGIQFNNGNYTLVLDDSATSNFKVTFLSTDKMGIPLLTGMEFYEQIIASSNPVTAVNQMTSIEASINSMQSYGQIYRIGIDGNNDGQLNSSDDDYITVQMMFK